jgi:hypothetical protein
VSQPELLKRVIAVLDANSVDYMVTGSIVSSSQGQPRATHDIDLVVKLSASAVEQIVKAFPAPRYYLDALAVREAIAQRNMFNLLEVDTGDKVDFWMLTDDPYDHARFTRRVPAELAGIPAHVSRPEDTILQKLRWSELSGGSEKQFNDAKGVYELQFPLLNLTYLEEWVVKLNVQDLWDRLKRDANPID